MPKLDAWRITLTAPFANRSREVLVLVTGQGKAAALTEVLEGDQPETKYPLKLIQPTDGRLAYLIDAAAAGM